MSDESNEDTPEITKNVRIGALAARLQQVYEVVLGRFDHENTWHPGLVQLQVEQAKKLDRIFYVLLALISTSIVNTLHLGSIPAIFQVLLKVFGL